MFIQHGFGHKMHQLQALTNEDLKEMGIVRIAHRKEIIKQVQNNTQQLLSINGLNEGDHMNNGETQTLGGVDSDDSESVSNEQLFAQQQQMITVQNPDEELYMKPYKSTKQ